MRTLARLTGTVLLAVILTAGLFLGPAPIPLAAQDPPLSPAQENQFGSIAPAPPETVTRLREEGGGLLSALQSSRIGATPVQPLQGNINLLVILVDFVDNPRTVTNLNVFDTYIFAPPVGGPWSVRDYFDEVSYSNVTLVTVNAPSTTGWQMAPNPYSYYTFGMNGMWGPWPNNSGGLLWDILPQVDALVDLSNYDNNGDGWVDTIAVIHAGTGAEFSTNPNHIWSHASRLSWMGGVPYASPDNVLVDGYFITPEYWDPALTNPNASDITIGVFCHELGHAQWGLPDLYDLTLVSNGIGIWGLMGYGNWNGPAKWNPYTGWWITNGSVPAWPSAWSRLALGFDTATLIQWGMDNFVFQPVETGQNRIYRLKSISLAAQEHFLVENRQRFPGSGRYDEYLPASGLLIWHADEAMWNLFGGADNSSVCTTIPHCSGACALTHYMVALEQADGNDDLELMVNFGDGGDPFPGTSGNTIWTSYTQNPVNPESNSWYDTACATFSCIGITAIYPSGSDVWGSPWGVCNYTDGDLGDAPASQNHFYTPMTAYFWSGIQANYPTVHFWAPQIVDPGPRHHFAGVDSWLGSTVTGEFDADWTPDVDGWTNISPTMDSADWDSTGFPPGFDDGLDLPLYLDHCVPTNLFYTVTVSTVDPFPPPMPRFVNAWFDWNVDGDWADTPVCPGSVSAPEWAVQDEMLILYQGQYYRTSMPFVPYISLTEEAPYEAWMRLSLADMTAPAPQDGRGPSQGYDLGETEDYFLFLDVAFEKTVDVVGDPLPGQLVTYHLGYIVAGNIVGSGAVISDVLPTGVEYVSSNPPGTYDPGSRTVSWPLALIPDQGGMLDLEVQVTGAPSQTVTNTAYLLWGNTVWHTSSAGFHIGDGGGQPPVAYFTWSKPACVSSTVQFTNLTGGTPPITYSWDLDGDGLVDSTAEHPTWHYDAPGAYQVTLLAQNAYGQSSYADTVDALQPLSGVDIDGPISVLVGELVTYTAIVAPSDATNPQYLWNNGMVGESASYSWATPGWYSVTVTVSNDCGSVGTSLNVLVTSECISLTGVAVDGPDTLEVDEEGTYWAIVEPLTATHPSYLWNDGSSRSRAVYSWSITGTYSVAVTATNCGGGSYSDSKLVEVIEPQPVMIYLPVVFKEY